MNRNILIVIAGLAIACGSTSRDSAAPTESGTTLATGTPAPSLVLPTGSGDQIDLSDLEGKVVIVDFWASWCEPCKEELPVLESLYRKHRERGLEVLAVNIDEDRADAEALLSRLKVSFPILFDVDQSAVSRWAPPKMPTSYVVDREGNITVIQAGFEPGEAKRLEEKVLAHLE